MARRHLRSADLTVVVVGDEMVSIPVDGWKDAGFDIVERRTAIECASGDVTRGTWAGVSVLDLVGAAAMPVDTTHLQVAGTDGFCACVPVSDLLDGMLAFERVDGPSEATPRLLSDNIEGTRTVQEVRNVVGITLDPGHDRKRWETMPKKSSSDAPDQE
jgi:hypothetical protein